MTRSLLAIAAAAVAAVFLGLAPASGPVNTKCVMMNDEDVDSAVTVDHKGQTIGFCCKKCRGKWNALADSDKDARLAKVVPTALAAPAEGDSFSGEIVDLDCYLTQGDAGRGPDHADCAARCVLKGGSPAALLVKADPRSGGKDQLYLLISSKDRAEKLFTGNFGSDVKVTGKLIDKDGLKTILLRDDGAKVEPATGHGT